MSSTWKSTATVIVAFFLAAVPAHAQNFEGVVNYKITTSQGQTVDLAYMMKGDKIRQEMNSNGRQGAMIMDLGTHTMMMLVPQRKMYMKMDMDHAAQMAQGMQHQAATPPKVTDTGKSETVAGHKCEHYLVGDEQNVDICVATGMGYYLAGSGMRGRGNPNMPYGSNLEAWKKVFKNGFFPLKMEMQDQGGMTMEATSIEAKSLPDSLFAPPADYQEMQVPAAMPGRKP